MNLIISMTLNYQFNLFYIIIFNLKFFNHFHYNIIILEFTYLFSNFYINFQFVDFILIQ